MGPSVGGTLSWGRLSGHRAIGPLAESTCGATGSSAPSRDAARPTPPIEAERSVARAAPHGSLRV